MLEISWSSQFQFGSNDKFRPLIPAVTPNSVFVVSCVTLYSVSETIAISALERKESRGAHARTDMPDRDDKNWLKHVLVYKENDDAYRVDYLPVVITQWKPEERKY